MIEFTLDSRLTNDCFLLSESDQFIVLLMNNSLLPWFILVPKTDKSELYQLHESMQTQTYELINQLSKFISDEFKPDKLNVAAIGNIVAQMHIHIIGRYKSDPYWPGVVWGAQVKKAYTDEEVNKIKLKLKSILEI